MKKYLGLVSLFAAMVLFLNNAFAQIPQAINYQAVARNVSGTIIDNTSFNVRATILAGSPSGTPEYSETFSVTTNMYGLFNVALGRGIPVAPFVTADFAGIPWATGSFWLKIEIDILSTGTFLLMGTSEMLSVPYALFSANAATITSASSVSNDNDPNTTGGPCSTVNNLPGAGLPLAINDVATQSTSVNAVGLTGNVCDVNVALSITHTWDSDLDISLTSPGGTTVDISSDNGGAGDNYTNTVFDDAAATSVVAGAAPFTGSFQPEQLFSAFNGENPNGIWTLTITDDLGGDVGALTALTIIVTTDAPGTYVFLGEASTTITTGEETQVIATYSVKNSNTNPVFVKVTRDVSSGAGTPGTDIGFSAMTPPGAGATKYVSLTVADRETGLTPGTYYYKLWAVSVPTPGTENHAIIVNKH